MQAYCNRSQSLYGGYLDIYIYSRFILCLLFILVSFVAVVYLTPLLSQRDWLPACKSLLHGRAGDLRRPSIIRAWRRWRMPVFSTTCNSWFAPTVKTAILWGKAVVTETQHGVYLRSARSLRAYNDDRFLARHDDECLLLSCESYWLSADRCSSRGRLTLWSH